MPVSHITDSNSIRKLESEVEQFYVLLRTPNTIWKEMERLEGLVCSSCGWKVEKAEVCVSLGVLEEEVVVL